MDDESIIDLYWQRSESAIAETAVKYGRYCQAIAFAVLCNEEDAEECVSDTWMKAWNSMPPKRPAVLPSFLGRITRNLSISRLRELRAAKRYSGEADLVLDELIDCVSNVPSAEQEAEAREIGESLNRFLAGLKTEERAVFLSRYWFFASIREISLKTGLSENNVKVMLSRTRARLRDYLKEEGLT